MGCIVLGILVLSRCRGKVRESGVCEQFALIIVRVVLGRCRGKVRESGVCEQFALIMIVRVIIRVVLGEFCLGELPFAPTMAGLLQSFVSYF